MPLIIILFLLLPYEIVHSMDEYFLTLRNDKVNLRQGPSFDYPIKIFYKKKFLPVIIQDKSDNFRKVRDHENNSGWIHISQLSKKKAAITVDDDLILFSSSTIYDMLNKRSKRYDPTFPVQVKMTKGRVAWVESEVAAWIERKMAARFH